MGTLHIDNIGKAYKRYAKKSGRLAEWLGLGQRHELRWVLRDINLHINPGEAIGIIGANGAGKSTLLKIITGTTRPTTGSITATGRIAALLELGIGFHPEFTGRQNIHLSGQLAGMNTAEINRHMADIEAFADIGDYIDQPVRTYSSGMQVRLAFSVATAVRPDILIVDEALAVGDIFFQQKCFDRIRRFREQGATLLFVSHAMATVYALCDRVVLIDGGRIVHDGQPRAAIDLYNAMAAQRSSTRPAASIVHDAAASAASDTATSDTAASATAASATPDTAASATPATAASATSATASATASATIGSYGSAQVDILSVALLTPATPHAPAAPVSSLVGDSPATLRIVAAFHAGFADPHIGFQIRNPRGEAVFMTHTHGMGLSIGPVAPGHRVQVDFNFAATLAPGDYTITAGIAEEGILGGGVRASLARVHDACAFSIVRNPYGIHWDGLYNLAPVCTIQRLP